MLKRDRLRDIQEKVVSELISSLGVQAVMPMGSGKTITALTAIADMKERGLLRAAIVTAPVRVASSTWPDEIPIWEHVAHLDAVVLRGTPAKRAKLLAEEHDIYLVSLDSLVWLLDELKKYPDDDPRHDLLVIDELSRLRNPRGKRSKRVRRAAKRFDAIWGLTGTPRPNGWEDQWAPLQIISADEAWGQSFDDWRRAYFRPEDYYQRVWSVHPFAVPELAKIVDQWSFTVPPDAATDVPYNSGPEFDVTVPLSEAAADDIKKMEKDLLVELGRDDIETLVSDSDAVVAMTQAVASGKMSQILQGFLYEDGELAQRYENGKLAALREMLDDAYGEPVLVAYNFKDDLEALRAEFGDVPCLGSGVKDADAKRWIAEWNAGKIPLMLLHPASAGHGLNLQHGGRRLIWYSMTWSPELYAQTCKRIARPGQKLPVYVHRILADHWMERARVERVEEKMAEEAEMMGAMRAITDEENT